MISNRIANVRTWSYVANKVNWVENQDYWIERTKLIEDKLSDRLHEELTKTFIDKRASVLARGLKQDLLFDTKITDNNIEIDGQFIGKLKGLKLELDLKLGALDNDIKSLKKAARQTIGPELNKRIDEIIKNESIEIKDDFKIYWKKFPIAQLIPGRDYLNPNFNLMIDDIIEIKEIEKLKIFLKNWIEKKIKNTLGSLINLKNSLNQKSSIRALAYQLYENNGVVKRDRLFSFVKNIEQSDRKILRDMGVKFGRYHIFLHKLLKPEAVSLRIILWKNFHQKYFNLKPPTFGLNFKIYENSVNQHFMLLCGFERFDNMYVRIDILERLFMKIINSKNDDSKEILLIPEMLNLLGCSKENFAKLIEKMNYKTYQREDKFYFKYLPMKNKYIKDKSNINEKSPFNVLKKIEFK